MIKFSSLPFCVSQLKNGLHGKHVFKASCLTSTSSSMSPWMQATFEGQSHWPLGRVWVISILSANISRVIWELIFFIVRDKPWLGWRRGRVGYTSAGCLGLSNNSQTCGNCLKDLVLFKETFQQHGTHISMASISWHIQGVPKKLPFRKLSRTNPNYMTGQVWTTLDGLEHLGQLSSREIPEGWLFLGHPIHMNTWPSEHPCLSVAMATIPWKFTKLKISKNQFLIRRRGELCIAVYLKPSQSQSSPSSIWLKPAILLPPHPDVQSVKCLPTAQFYTFRNLPVKRINRDILCSKFRQKILLTS